MPVIQRQISIAANAVNENLLAGSAFEFARGPILVSIGLIQAATGLFATINSGSDVVVEEFEPFIDANNFPIIPDQMYYNDVATVGDRLVIRVRNSTAGAIVARVIAQITNL